MSQDFPTPLEIKALAEGEFSLQWAEIMQSLQVVGANSELVHTQHI